jgi:ABC-type phosphate transport system permease subunit
MKRTKNDWIALISFLFSLWFLLAGTVWVRGAALIFAYPFGLVSFILWRFFLKGERKESKLIPTILGFGLILSLLVLLFSWFSHSQNM